MLASKASKAWSSYLAPHDDHQHTARVGTLAHLSPSNSSTGWKRPHCTRHSVIRHRCYSALLDYKCWAQPVPTPKITSNISIHLSTLSIPRTLWMARQSAFLSALLLCGLVKWEGFRAGKATGAWPCHRAVKRNSYTHPLWAPIRITPADRSECRRTQAGWRGTCRLGTAKDAEGFNAMQC